MNGASRNGKRRFNGLTIATCAGLVIVAIPVALVLEWGNVPLDISLFAGLPFVCLFVMAMVFRRNTFEQVVLLVSALLMTAWGLAAMLDGLVLHTGILVTADATISHLVTLFVPLQQLVFCIAISVGLLIIRALRMVNRKSHSISLV